MPADVVTDWAVSAQSMAQRAWRWLQAHHARLSLPRDIAAEDLDSFRHLKPLGELALAASIGVREGALGQHGATIARGLLEFGWAQLGQGEVLYAIQRERPRDTVALETYSPFVRAGHRHRPLEELLAHLSTLRSTRVPGLSPEQFLAVVNAEQLLQQIGRAHV